MPVTDQTPIGNAVGNGVTTIVPFGYYVADDEDLVVQVDGVAMTLNVDYTLSGVGNESGGQITFSVAPAAGAQISHYRDTSLTRDIDYQTSGDLLANTLDFDIDRIWLVLQELTGGGKSIPNTIRVPTGETVPALPRRALRKNMQLLFDSNGDPYVAAPVSGSAADVLLQLINRTDANKGPALVGNNPALTYPLRTVGDRLRAWVRPQDLGATPGGTVDATAYVQQALDSGQPVLIDEIFLTSGNEVPSGTLLVFRGRGKLKLTDNANRPVLQNVNWNKAGWGVATYGLDRDIVIDGLNIDGNDVNQVHHLTTGPYAGEYVSGVRFFGVTNLTIKNTTISKARTFGIWCAAILNGTYNNIRFDQTMTGTPDNQDGLHINGPAKNLDIRNLKGSTNDDMVALNADDGALGANVTAGPITDALIDGVYPVDCLNGVRLLSATSRMDQITVRSVKGSTRDVAVNQSPFGLGVGNVGTLTIEDIDVHCSNPYQPTTSDYYSVITLDGVIENVSISDIKNNQPADNRPTVRVAGTANIGLLSIDGMNIVETGTSTLSGVKPVSVYGLVNTLTVRGVNYFRDSLLTPTGNLISINAPGKGVTNLSCSDIVTQRLVAPIDLADGLLGNVTLVNIDDRDGLPAFPLLNLSSVSGATTNVDMLNCSTGTGRELVARSGLSVFGSRVAIDKAGSSGAAASLPANQALGAAAYTKLNFATEIYDRIGEYDTTAQTFTVTQGPGVYQVHCSVDLTIPTNPTDGVLALYKGGVIYRVLDSRRMIGDTAVVASALVSVAQGDVFDVRMFVSAAATAKTSNSTTVFFERLK